MKNMILDPRKQEIIEEYYPKLNEILIKLAEIDYRQQEYSISFPVGNIQLTVYGEASSD